MSDEYTERNVEQMTDAVEGRDALRALLATRGWEILNGWMQQEVDLRRKEYEENAPLNMGDTYITGFRRAQLSMLRTIQDMPQKLLDMHEQAIEQVKIATGGYDAED